MWIGHPRRQPHDLLELLARHGAQAVRRDAKPYSLPVRLARDGRRAASRTCSAVHEAALHGAVARREVAVRVEDGQQREPIRPVFAAATMRHASSAGSAIRLAVRIVMNVVEFRDRRVSRLRHLDVRLAGDRLERSASSRSTAAYIACRHVQNVSSRVGDGKPGATAIARWNACECRRSASPGSRGPPGARRLRQRARRSIALDAAVVGNDERDVGLPTVGQQGKGACEGFIDRLGSELFRGLDRQCVALLSRSFE
jgi:hypothetical protein